MIDAAHPHAEGQVRCDTVFSVAANQYHFTTHWCFDATAEEIADVLGNPLDLPRWWPSVYLSATELEVPNADGVGARVLLHTRGWLPYTLCWELLVLTVDYPRGFTIAAAGDLEGTGVWTFEQRGAQVDVTFDWRVAANKPLL